MIEIPRLLLVIHIIILLITIISALIYLLPIIFIRRFHTVTNIFTGNFCLAGIIYCLFWLVFDVLTGFYFIILDQSIASCILTQYFSTMVSCLVVYSLTMITIDRYFIIIHPTKRLFKTQRCSFISLGLQWIFAVVLPLPHLILSFQSCRNTDKISWINIYGLIIIVILPSIVNIGLNLSIFFSVHSSTRRVHASIAITSSPANPNHHGRDVHLLKHILFVFILFIGGWTPTYVFLVVDSTEYMFSQISLLLRLLPVLSSLINIVDLLFYNHEIRRHVTERLLKCLPFNAVNK